jgi:hypothetical protein
MSVKESDVNRAFSTVLSHVKNKVKTNVVEAQRKNIIVGIEEDQLQKLCNLIDISIDQAATDAIYSESKGLMEIFKRAK